MYPFGDLRGFVRNRWYIAALTHEVGTEPLGRTFLNVPVVLYRTEAGKVVAMYSLCPHRYLPMSMGKVRGDALVCPYHGFTFGSDGKCIHIPSQGTGAGYVQPTYPVEERGSLIWIWMGDPSLADPDRIPPYEDFGLDQEGWVSTGHEYFKMKGRIQLLIENLMDLTHLPHVHNQIGGGEVLLRTKQETEERPHSLRLRQTSPIVWNPFLTWLWGEAAEIPGEFEIASVTDFYGPELVRTSLPVVTAPGAPANSDPILGVVYFLHGATPATDHETHYFCLQTRNFRLDDEEFGAAIAGMDSHIRSQDITIIEALEPVCEEGAAKQPEMLVKTDRTAIRVRNMIRDWIVDEDTAASASAAA